MLYMVLHGSHQYSPFMLALIYQHHGSHGVYYDILCMCICWFSQPQQVHKCYPTRIGFNVSTCFNHQQPQDNTGLPEKKICLVYTLKMLNLKGKRWKLMIHHKIWEIYRIFRQTQYGLYERRLLFG